VRGRLLLILLFLLAVFLGGEGISFYTDWLWFREVGYQTIFARILTTQILLSASFGLATTSTPNCARCLISASMTRRIPPLSACAGTPT